MVMIRNYQQPGNFGVLARKGQVAEAPPVRVLITPKRAVRLSATAALLEEIYAVLAERKLLRSRFETLCRLPGLISFMEDGRAVQPETEQRVRGVMANLLAGVIA